MAIFILYLNANAAVCLFGRYLERDINTEEIVESLGKRVSDESEQASTYIYKPGKEN